MTQQEIIAAEINRFIRFIKPHLKKNYGVGTYTEQGQTVPFEWVVTYENEPIDKEGFSILTDKRQPNYPASYFKLID